MSRFYRLAKSASSVNETKWYYVSMTKPSICWALLILPMQQVQTKSSRFYSKPRHIICIMLWEIYNIMNSYSKVVNKTYIHIGIWLNFTLCPQFVLHKCYPNYIYVNTLIQVEKIIPYRRMSYLDCHIIILQNNASFDELEWSALFVKDSYL
jgi:hypothetical protein